MTRTIRHRLILLPSRQQGLAIGLILVACLLVGAIGVALAMSARSGNLTSENKKNGLLAITLIEQADHYKNAYVAAIGAKGQYHTDPDDSSYPLWALSDPNNGFMERQGPPPDAYINPGSAAWIYKYDYTNVVWVVYLENVGGENNPDLVVATTNLKLAVCQQINQQLLGTTSIPAPGNASNTSTNWSTAANTIDLRGATAVSGLVAACIKTTDGQYVYYTTLHPE